MKFRIRQFVCCLIFLIVIGSSLDGIVSEMHKLVVKVIDIVYLAGGSDVAISVPVGFDLSVDAG